MKMEKLKRYKNRQLFKISYDHVLLCLRGEVGICIFSSILYENFAGHICFDVDIGS